jgi:hypothetical protein
MPQTTKGGLQPTHHAHFTNFIVESCRDNTKYNEKLFEKIDLIINELRSDKELIKKEKRH